MTEAEIRSDETQLAYEVRWLKKPDDETSKKDFKSPSRIAAENKAVAMSIKFGFADLGEWQVGDGDTDLLIQRRRYENGNEVFHEMPLKEGKEITRPTTNPKLSKEHGKAVEMAPDLPDVLNRAKNGIKPKSAKEIGTPEKEVSKASATSKPGDKPAKQKSKERKSMRTEVETTTITKRVIRDDGAKKLSTKKSNGAKKAVKAKAAPAKEIVKRSVDMATLKKPAGSMTEAIKKMEIRENSFLFDAFQMFMKNPGAPVTFSALMKTIYGNTKSESPLNLLIFNVRKRLKDYKIPMQLATLNKNGERAYGLFAK